MSKNFVLLGLAGYVAPKHLKAIKDTGGSLLAAMDVHDSVGILDSYFPECQFFTEFERFSRYCETSVTEGTKIDYISICSPNYLHMSHCMFALRVGANVICEKPIVLHERNLDKLLEIENNSIGSVYPILQTRLHPKIIELKDWCDNVNKSLIGKLTYVTSRGDWYKYSWKGDERKSGGLITNIGIHLLDMLYFLFGRKWTIVIRKKEEDEISGILQSQDVYIDFYLSLRRDVPIQRVLSLDGVEIDFTKGFTELHTKSYSEIINGRGFDLETARTSIRMCEAIRNGALGTPISIYR